MRKALHGAVRRWWGGGGGPFGAAAMWAAAPLEWLFRGAVAARNRRFAARPGVRLPGLAVVSVGNLTVGGTGKTPMTRWVVAHLLGAGARCAVLARGYGADEVLLHRRWHPGVPVVADPDRIAGARLAAERGAEVVVLDDAFQHRGLARDVDLVLLAVEDAYPGRLLPRGPYREPPSALARADAVVVTRREADAAEARALAARVGREHGVPVTAVVALEPGGWADLHGTPADPPGGALLAVAGVARPEAFAAQVRAAAGTPVELVGFPDHHAFTRDEAVALRRRAGDRTLVVTEKDAVKLEGLEPLLGPVRVLLQAIRWEAGEGAVRALITERAGGGD